MGRILFFLVAIIAVAISVLIFAPNAIPVAAYKDRIETAASASVGREVTIGDNISFRIIPQTAFHVEDLTVANSEGFDGDYLARVGEADIGVNVFKMFSGEVEVSRFVLTEPEINLIRNASGDVNWNIAQPTETTADSDNESREIRDIKLGDVRIINGKAQYRDDAAGASYAAEDMDLSIVLKSLNEPLEVAGTMIFQNEPTTVDIVLTTLADILDQDPSNLKLDMKVGDTTAGADLTVETNDGLRYSGPIDFDAPDLPAFAALVGAELADAPGFDRLALAGNVDGSDTALRLDGATIGFDEILAQGVLNLDWSGDKPNAGGVLSTDQLDLRPYMPPPVENAAGFPAWSEAKMDFSSLRNIDADFDVSTGAIFLNDMKFGESRLKLRLDNGRMTADIPELSMYGGLGSGQVVVNARGATPSLAGNFEMDAVEAQPFSLDLLKHDNLLGIGALTFNFTATGDSQAAIMSSLDGEGGFDLANGALKGVNIPKIARAVASFQEGFNPVALQSAVTAARGPDEETDFSQFLSNFQIVDGLVTAPTISMVGPFINMTGNGSVNLPLQTIDIRLLPRASTAAEGDGGRTIAIPMMIGGTFSQPTIGVDAEALVRSGAEQQIRNLLGGLGRNNDEEAEGAPADEGGAEETQSPEGGALRAIEGLFGNNNDNEEPTSEEESESDEEASLEETIANEAINALFGGQNSDEENTEDGEEE